MALEAACAGAEEYKGLVHTLTHEAAHIYDYFAHVTPFVEQALAAASDTSEDKDFTRGFWEAYSKTATGYSIPRRAETAAYGLGKKLPLSAALEQYKALAKTPFFSFYGSGSWAEDFAEAAAWTWLGRKLGISYSVSISAPGGEGIVFKPGAAMTSKGRENAIGDALE